VNRGVAVVSIDTELAWGEAHRRRPAGGPTPAAHDYDAERPAIDGLLAILERHEIPATWAVVGHLLLSGCSAENGPPHPEVVRPDFDWLDGDWFDIDPCGEAAAAPWYYGPDIVERIRASAVAHEIGCHSFAHVMAGEPGCSVEAFRSDLAACVAVARERGLSLRSFVFPRNSVGHVDELAGAEFTSYRGRPPPARRARHAVHPLRAAGGVWNIPQTFLFAPATHLHRLPTALWARVPIRRMRQAARRGSLFHLWLHPYNITADPPRALDAFDRVCAEAARLRSRGRLDVLTMGDLAERLGAQPTSNLSTRPTPAQVPQSET
jgi:peptidoglycan/xylan/chitin deacetylase (PgdA/CDA1 family)